MFLFPALLEKGGEQRANFDLSSTPTSIGNIVHEAVSWVSSFSAAGSTLQCTDHLAGEDDGVAAMVIGSMVKRRAGGGLASPWLMLYVALWCPYKP